MSKSYGELLKDPRWQKKRLEVLSRDSFECLRCGAKDKTLHVHHKYYEYGRNPWEYEGFDLVTVCDECHEILTTMSKEIKEILKYSKLWQLEQMHGYMAGLFFNMKIDDASELNNLVVNVRGKHNARGLADSIGKRESEDRFLALGSLTVAELKAMAAEGK